MFKATNIATPEMIYKSCEEVQLFIEATYDADNPTECVARAQSAEGYMGLTSKMLADAKYHYDSLLNGIFIDAIKKAEGVRMQTSTLNKYIDTLCYDYNYLVTWSDRLNRSCTHCLDLQRSFISKLKAEFSATSWHK